MTNATKAQIATQVTHPISSGGCVLSLYLAVQPPSGLQEKWNRTVQSLLKLPASPCLVTFSTGKAAAFSGDQLSQHGSCIRREYLCSESGRDRGGQAHAGHNPTGHCASVG